MHSLPEIIYFKNTPALPLEIEWCPPSVQAQNAVTRHTHPCFFYFLPYDKGVNFIYLEAEL